jgi:transposase-like protein
MESITMPQRRHFDGTEKMAILREHLIEKKAVSEVCEKHSLQPTVFYQWQQKLFEDGAVVFETRRESSRQQDAQTKRLEFLETKVRQKDEVLGELMAEYVSLKKSLGLT